MKIIFQVLIFFKHFDYLVHLKYIQKDHLNFIYYLLKLHAILIEYIKKYLQEEHQKIHVQLQ